MPGRTTNGTATRVAPRDRRRQAAFIRSTLRDARAERPLLRGYRPLVRRAVALACEPALIAMLTTLEDATVTLDQSAGSRLRSFLTDGATSPLYGHDADSAQVTAGRLADALQATAVAVGERRARAPRLIVHATDGSSQADDATGTALGLCLESGARLAVVSVHTVPAGGKGLAPSIHATETTLGTKRISESVAAKARALGIDATAYTRAGNPSKEIAALADELGADMIVVGSRGYGPLRGAFSGSVSHDLIKRAHVPVTVMHEAANA